MTKACTGRLVVVLMVVALCLAAIGVVMVVRGA